MNNEFESFRDIELSDKQTLQSYFLKQNSDLSIYNFANLFMWGRLHKYKWSLFKKRLVIYNEPDDVAVMPLGEPLAAQEFLELAQGLLQKGRKADFCFVPKNFIEKNPSLEKYFLIEPDEKNADYIYSTQKLFELRGKKLRKKKNLLKQFQKNNPEYICQKLEPNHYYDCIDLNEKWCQDKSCDIVAFAYETDALRMGCKHYKELGLDGRIILIDNKVAAFAVFNRQNTNMALVHFEKYDRELKGAGQAINWETAKYLMNDYELVNREQDLGIPGLRQAKESYQPDYKALTYRLSWKD